MNIIGYTLLDDCLGGSSYYELTFDGTWTADTIHLLANLGDLEYHEKFARPYFQLRGQKRFILKGLEGENTCRLIVPSASFESLYHEIESTLKNIQIEMEVVDG